MDRAPRLLAAAWALTVALALVSPSAGAHESGVGAVAGPLPGVTPFAAGLFGSRSALAPTPPGDVLAPTTGTKVIDGTEDSEFVAGPCTSAAKAAVPDGGSHDHLDVTQHRFACNLQEVAFLSLKEELGAREDVILGEMDIKAGIAAVAVAYPEAGALFFDVKEPGKPKFLSWYRGGECEGAAIDIDCGAFIDLSADGKTAFLSTQNTTAIPGSPPPVGTLPNSVPGVYTLDLTDPTAPLMTDVYPVANGGGVHTARSHVIPDRGEFVFTNTLSAQGATDAQVEILRVDRTLGVPRLVPVGGIAFDELHDMFIQQDELDGKTYLYVAGGFSSGFIVYDVSDPSEPVLKAEWDLTPQCADDWYSHTLDVVVRNGRRFVTLPAEMISSFGDQSDEDQAEGCGKLAGNGDVPGPLWIVDATDFAKLGPASPVAPDAEAPLGAASRAALVATWTNPADRAGGNLTFSPHNQQIVGNRIYVSAYHAGVYVLDATEAFAGKKVRPKEVGLIVPSNPATRPIFEPAREPVIPFFSSFPAVRPEIWDTYAYEGIIYAADMRGGFYAIDEIPTEAPTGAPAAGRPVVTMTTGATPPPVPAPAAKALTKAAALKLSRTRGGRARCRSTGITASLRGTGTAAITSVTFLAGRKRLGTDARSPFTLRTTRARIGRVRAITARVTYVDGTVQRLTRRVLACR